MTNRQRVEHLERLRREREAQFLPVDPHKPVYFVSEYLPPVGYSVKVWDAQDRGTTAKHDGKQWDEFQSEIGTPVKWQHRQRAQGVPLNPTYGQPDPEPIRVNVSD